MERTFIVENTRERERLRSLVARLSDEELGTPLGTDWTVAVAFAHLAFWDHRALVLTRKLKLEGVESSPVDVDVTNDSLLPTWLALPPRIAADLAVSAAEAIDGELANASDALVAKIESLGENFRLFRSIHRQPHLDQIEEALQKAG